MAPIIDGPPEAGEPERPWGKRLLWFAALACGSAVVVAIVAYVLRALLL
jgi:hypothetical protein